jgi:hypothetical protein
MTISIRIPLIFAVCLVATLVDVRASTTYSGSISGTFSNPVLTGYVIDLQGNHVPLDNTTTAVYTGIGTNSITWGQAFPGFPDSILTFTGKSFSGVTPGQVFDLGTVTYFNGTNLNDTFIFGATLTLSVNSTLGGSIDPAVSNLGFIATQNRQPPPNTLKVDADFITFDVFPVTFNVFEGASASADLFGMIVGDPSLTITGIQLNPGQENNGFIGQGQPSIPDTGSTLCLLGLALGSLGGVWITTKNVSGNVVAGTQ